VTASDDGELLDREKEATRPVGRRAPQSVDGGRAGDYAPRR